MKELFDFLRWIFESFERWLGLVILIGVAGDTLRDTVTNLVRGLIQLVREARDSSGRELPPPT